MWPLEDHGWLGVQNDHKVLAEQRQSAMCLRIFARQNGVDIHASPTLINVNDMLCNRKTENPCCIKKVILV